MSSINLIGKVSVGQKEFELTKLLLYVQKDAKKQATTLLFEDKNTLEDIGVMDKQALIVTEVLTDVAKTIIQQHYFDEAEANSMIVGEESKINVESSNKNKSLLQTHLDYSSESH